MANEDITPVVDFVQAPPVHVFSQGGLDDAYWLLRCWRPGEHDSFGQEAYRLVEHLSEELMDARDEASTLRALLYTAVHVAHGLDEILDEVRGWP